MAWQQDLKPCDYFGVEFASVLRAVGWLERGHPFPTGEVDRRIYDRLTEFNVSPWQPMVAMGFHTCGLCLYWSEAQGKNTLFIPGDGVVFVCPELVTHYMNAHGYAPPAEFCLRSADLPADAVDGLSQIFAGEWRQAAGKVNGG